MQKPKMMIGEKGVKYGLIKTGPKSVSKPVAKPQSTNVFGDDESDEDVEAQVQRQAEKKRAAAKVQSIYESALAEDPSVFDYDGVYDQIQADRVAPQQQEKTERKSRYIAQLKEQAERRKREDDVLQERRMLKERTKEDHLFEGKEEFITSSYRKKLEEQKLWAEKEKARELAEEKHDVRKVGHMGNFYANLMNKNVAFGGQASSSQDKGEDKGAEGDGKDKEKPGRSGRGSGDEDDDEEEEEPDKPSIAEAAAKAGVQLDKYDLIRMEAERALKGRKEREKERDGEQGAAGGGGLGSSASDAPPVGACAGKQAGGASGAAAETVPDASGSAPPAGKRKHDESAVLAARERYLARKKQHGGA